MRVALKKVRATPIRKFSARHWLGRTIPRPFLLRTTFISLFWREDHAGAILLIFESPRAQNPISGKSIFNEYCPSPPDILHPHNSFHPPDFRRISAVFGYRVFHSSSWSHMVNFSEIYFSLHSSVCGGDSRRVQQPQQSGRLRRGQQLNVQRSIKKIPLFDCQIFTLSFSDEVRRYSFVLLLSPLLPIYALPKVAGSVINKKRLLFFSWLIYQCISQLSTLSFLTVLGRRYRARKL